jgi:hypothetical protein
MDGAQCCTAFVQQTVTRRIGRKSHCENRQRHGYWHLTVRDSRAGLEAAGTGCADLKGEIAWNSKHIHLLTSNAGLYVGK